MSMTLARRSSSHDKISEQQSVPGLLPRRVGLKYALIIVVYAIIFAFWQAEPVPWHVYVAGLVVFATCLVPITLWYARGNSGLPMFELICLSYALQFSAPLYHQPNGIVIFSQWVPLPWIGAFVTLVHVELGVLALMAGYYWFRRRNLAQSLPSLDLPLIPQRRGLYVAGALGIGLFIATLQVTGGAPSGGSAFGAFVYLGANQLRLAIVILAYQTYTAPQRRLINTLILGAAVTLAVGLGLATGLLENALLPPALFILVRWHVTRKFPLVLISLGLVGFLMLNTVKRDYRNQVWYGNGDLGPAQRIGLWLDLSQQAVEETAAGGLAQASDRLKQALARFDLLHKFIYVHEMTPRFVPFYKGQTYSYLLVGWIPRFLWADKPSASLANNRTDVDYQFLSDRQALTTGTNIGIGQLPEAYANFGLAGIMIMMALQGVAFGTLDKVLNGHGSEGGRAIYLTVMVVFLNGIGSSTAILFGALLQNILANALILRLFAAGFRIRPKPDTVVNSFLTHSTRAISTPRQPASHNPQPPKS